MTVDFRDYFWGEKNNGFDVLYHNMKYGLVASKELVDFLRERSNIEENNWKLVSKLAKQAGGSCSQGTFGPVWSLLRTTAERLASLHLQMVHKVGDLVKEVSKYAEDLHRKHKTVKEEEGGTLEVVQAIQSTSLTLQKARDSYTQKGIELDRLRKESASPRELEKAEQKLRKAQDEYKLLFDKYGAVKEEFEKKMSLACKHFQEVEEIHLKQMKEFLTTYAELVENNHDLMGQVHIEFKRQCLEMTVDKLLEQFVLNKYTGVLEVENLSELLTPSESGAHKSMPAGSVGQPAGTQVQPQPAVTAKREGNCGVWEKSRHQSRRATSLLNIFLPNSQGKDRAELASSAPTSPTSVVHAPDTMPDATPLPTRATTTTDSTSQVPSICRQPVRASKWFLRSRRDKRKDKKGKKKKDVVLDQNSKEEKSDVEDKEETIKSKTPTPEVDEEGYCVRPKVESWDIDKGSSFYSSSDTDSADEEREKKIRVEIKPLSNGAGPISASVDELRATVENLSLSPLGTVPARRINNTNNHMKRSQSVSQQIGGKISSDAINLNLVQSPTGSSASTPTGNHPYAPLQSPTPPISTATNKYSDLSDLFSEAGNDTHPTLTTGRKQASTPSSASSIIIPRPPSRRSEGGVRSPVPGTLSYGDSTEFRTSGIALGTSRGPSPLTIGIADTIPLAVAFHEIIHSYFKGVNEEKCQVKLCGDMMVSFPAGIVSILTNKPSPAQLSFRLHNSANLENILPNKQLINMDSFHTFREGTVFDFNMCALTNLLRRQSEQNPSASYFNVDILKYQIKSKPGAESCPLQLVAYWKCDATHTDLKVDYKYNSHAMASPSPLLNLTVAVPVDGRVKNMQSKPSAVWMSEANRAVWKFTELSQHCESSGVGSLRARFEVSDGPSNPATLAAQFNCEGTTLSGIDFSLHGHGYRISLVKRRFVSGKYICDGGDSDVKFRYATPPTLEC
ncbi:F-BAR domain only protein 2 isoform X3 [Rhodnius prolixus]|uniref:F-BAR domain only protein 2 isoform X3 n=1 Tax=Rhodnius prolixus TaxID=13249 RepID=UPI003D18B9D3